MDICKCDVRDKGKLALFLEKRSEWKRCLIDDRINSIDKQIIEMIKNDTFFRTFNEARKIAVNSNYSNIGLNGPLMRLLDEGFIELQVMAIRRLTDRNFINPKKAVISMIRIIDDIKANNKLFTRENFICYDGTSYNEPHISDKNMFHWTTRQDNFDKLSDVNPQNRSRTDILQKSILDALKSTLKVCGDIREFANKFVAHAADPTSYSSISYNITFEKLDECYQAITKAGKFLSSVLIYEEEIGGVAQSQYDIFTNLDKPMVLKNDFGRLKDFQRKRDQAIEQWQENFWPIV